MLFLSLFDSLVQHKPMIEALMTLTTSIVSFLAELTTNDTQDDRALLPADDQDSPLSSSHNSNESTFTSGVFWAVNAVWIVVFLSLICWCWKCGGAERLTAWIQHSQESSDEQFADRVRRMQQEQQTQLNTPEQRKKELQDSFMRNKVKMIVSANDYVQDKADPDTAPAADMKNEDNDDDDGGKCNTDTSEMDTEMFDDRQADVGDREDPVEELDDLCTMEQGLAEQDEVASEPIAGTEESDTNFEVFVGRTDLESNSAPRDTCTSWADGSGVDVVFRKEGGNASDLDAIEAGLVEAKDNEEDEAESLAHEDDGEQNNHLAVMNDCEIDAEAESGYLSLSEQQRTVPNCCAVCLCSYEEGESLVWSSNKLCQHAFHEECIIDWLVKMQDGTPCPCCRQPFTDLVQPQKKKKVISWEPGRSLDPSVIRLR